MLCKRIIPCLDVKDGRVVKGVNFVGLRDAGDPVELAKFYSQEGADEIVFLDITATSDNRDTIADVVRRTCREVFVPVTVGGGIRTVDDFREILRAGADKISINSSAVKNPDLVNAAAEKYGSQCVVVAIDARANAEMPSGFEVYVAGGRTPTGKDAVAWAKEVYERGAGEISTAFSLNHSFSDILTGIILFFIIGSEFFINYKINFRKTAKKEED